MIMKSEAEMLSTMAAYCSQAERCVYDVRKKIKNSGLPDDVEKRIIARLIEEKFIDEKRFSRSFVNDKFKFNKWGRVKICYELRKREIKPEIYYDAIYAIDEEEYIDVLTDLMKTKKRTVKGNSKHDLFQKLCRFASSRGFEPELIVKVLKSMLKGIESD